MSDAIDIERTVIVTGVGGFIGGHLVADLLEDDHTDVRAVDVKPSDRWLQRHEGAENRSRNLKREGGLPRGSRGRRRGL